MKQGGADDSLCGGLPTDRRLRSYRSGPSVSLDLPWIAIHASAASFSLAAGPSNRSRDHPGVFASCPMVSTPFSARRTLVTGPTPHISSTGRW